MLKLLVIIAVVLVVVIAAFLAFVSTRPNAFHVERSATIKAPPAVVFGFINDLHAWTAWSPWENLDPQLKRTYSGAESGVGAKYAWVGNSNVGEGRMTIEESRPSEFIGIKLEFIKPFAGTNQAKFTLTPTDGGTRVVWTMDGNYNFITKAVSTVMNMDSMIGTSFEQGLRDLDKVSQAKASGTPAN